ncbi:MAG: 23S rRNA (uracil(1939)-C(5))-methyltransferase RlmD [bacterium]|nr:23S rRNA (uracil(1939)-C(5))-methyltransferase RlmD [bacterium]
MEQICKHYENCGGCSLRHLDYIEQLKDKKQNLIKVFEKVNLDSFLSNNIEIIPSQNINYYRNKMEFTFFDNQDELGLGLHKYGEFNSVVDIKNCLMQTPETNRVLEITKEWVNANDLSAYNKKKHTGILRTLIIRYSKSMDTFMLNFVATESFELSSLVQDIIKAEIKVQSVYLSINKRVADSAFSDETKLIYGEPYLIENIDGYSYKIGPYSFFQVNSLNILKMYQISKEWLKSGDVLIDLYSGVGGFAIYLASEFKNVLGIEVNDEAVKLAKENIADNKVENCKFFCGRVENILNNNELVPLNAEISMLVDPPRSGLGRKAIKNILKVLPSKLVYTSCKVETLVDDLNILKEIYDIVDFKAIDMFPQTTHIETMTFLRLKDNPNLSFLVSETKRSCLNMLNISEFNTDDNGQILHANNTCHKFINQVFDKELDNIVNMLNDPKVKIKSASNNGFLYNTNSILNANSGMLVLEIKVGNKLRCFNFIFEKILNGFKGLITDYHYSFQDFFQDSIFEKFSEDIFLTDTSFNVEKVNRLVLTNLVVKEEEVIGRKWNDIANIRDFEVFFSAMKESLSNSGIWEGELLLVDYSGKVLYYYCTILVVNISGIQKYLVINKNISDGVFLERELIVRTNQSNRLIREVDSLISLVRSEEDSPFFYIRQKIQDKDILDKSIRLFESKINNLRNSWFFNLALNDFNMGTYNAVDIINSEIKKFDIKLNEKQLKTSLNISMFIESVYLDKSLFEEMFDEIFENAVKFSPENSIIYVNICKKNGFVKISIIDEGPGISPENHNKIFSKYVKVGDFPAQEGEGLGLSVVRDIADVHSGRVWVESPLKGKQLGSAFILQIPIEKRSFIR